MTTPENSDSPSEETPEFNLADYEIEETDEEEESAEKTEQAHAIEDVRALLRQSAKEEKKAEATLKPLTEEPLQKISPEELTLTLSIEAGSIELPLEQLLSLKAGAVLETGLRPEQGVQLMVGKQCVGKGELIKIGDTIGVRILEI